MFKARIRTFIYVRRNIPASLMQLVFFCLTVCFCFLSFFSNNNALTQFSKFSQWALVLSFSITYVRCSKYDHFNIKKVIAGMYENLYAYAISRSVSGNPRQNSTAQLLPLCKVTDTNPLLRSLNGFSFFNIKVNTTLKCQDRYTTHRMA